MAFAFGPCIDLGAAECETTYTTALIDQRGNVIVVVQAIVKVSR